MTLETLNRLFVQAQPYLLSFLARVAIAIAVFVVGRWLAHIAKRLLKKTMTKAQVEPTLTGFASNILLYLILTFVVLTALGAAGIETTSLIAAIGAAALAVGLALQGSLANFAAGIIIIIFKPFRVGDWVEANGHSGYISDIEVLTTILRTSNNRTVIIPNGLMTTKSLVNYSTLGKLRLELIIRVACDSDIDRVKSILYDVVTANEKVLSEPKPVVGLCEIADSSLNFKVMPWAETKDYMPLGLILREAIKKRLDAEGIIIPFSQTAL
jgi:small conductance mechanosensitive channel